MKIQVITPIIDWSLRQSTLPIYAASARPDCDISVVGVDAGPASIECLFEDALAIPDVLNKARSAERTGMDAVIIDCMNDPGLEAAREALSIPVVGVAQSAMLLASLLAHRFSVVSTATRDVYQVERLVTRYGLGTKYASTRAVDIPVLELGTSREHLLEALVDASRKAVLQDGAQAIVFGCTGMKGLARAVQESLKKQGMDVIVIDPSLAALKFAEMLVDLKLAPSKSSYPFPHPKQISGYDNLQPGKPQIAAGCLERNPFLRVVIPVIQGPRPGSFVDETQVEYGRACRPGTRLDAVVIDQGPASIESWYDEGMAVPGILSKVKQAALAGADAVILDCMSDPGMEPARELVSIPVIGPAQTAMILGAALSHSFSVLGTLREQRHRINQRAAQYGLTGRLASVRAVGLSVLELESRPELLFEALVREAEQAVKVDGAHLLIPGCTGMIGLADRLQQALAGLGCEVPVIDPPAAAVKMAEVLVDLGLAQSKATYPAPPAKKLAGYPGLEV